MSDHHLIPEITETDFLKVLRIHQLKRLKSCEVFRNCEYLFTFVNGMTEPSGFLRTQTEYNAKNANAVSGETIEQILACPPIQYIPGKNPEIQPVEV